MAGKRRIECKNYVFPSTSTSTPEGEGEPRGYYTIQNVEDSLTKLLPPPQASNVNILPTQPLAKSSNASAVYDSAKNSIYPPPPLSSKLLGRDELDKRFGWRSQDKLVKVGDGRNKDDIKTPLFIAPFSSPTRDRAEGRAGKVIKVGLKNGKGEQTEVYIIFLFYEMLIGAIGGMLLAIETGRFSMEEVGRGVWGSSYENVKNNAGSVLKNGVVRSAIVYRGGKRLVGGGLLYNFVHKNVEQSRNKKDWINSLMAGGVCGGLYGVRGGLRCSGMGAVVFALFAGTSGIYEQMNKTGEK